METAAGYTFQYRIDKSITEMVWADIVYHLNGQASHYAFELHPVLCEPDSALFHIISSLHGTQALHISQQGNSTTCSCSCEADGTSLCFHQAQALSDIMNKPHLRIFFDAKSRREKLRQFAKDYGMENEIGLDEYFEIVLTGTSVELRPKIKELFPIKQKKATAQSLVAAPTLPPSGKHVSAKMLVVIGKHRYYDQLDIKLFDAALSKDGKIKHPLTPMDPLEQAWKSSRIEEVKFFTGISKFQDHFKTQVMSDIEGLKLIMANPLNLDIYYHDAGISEKINAASIQLVKLDTLAIEVNMTVDLREPFYEVYGELVIAEKTHPLKTLKVICDYFIRIADTLYLVSHPDFLRIIDFFRKNNFKILIHTSQYEEFRRDILSKLENQVQIRYSYIRKATKKQAEEQGFNEAPQKLLYLTDHDMFVSLMPVVKYGNVEVPVRSRKQVHDIDRNGNMFMVERDERLEVQFTASLVMQHPDFNEQLLYGDSFFLHRDKFLDEDWFQDAFEAWEREQITVMGFNDLRNNKLNQHKANISIHVNSGIDWFDTSLVIKFGKQKASLKNIQKAARNKSSYVQLDDGTQGILPREWMLKLGKYFQYGEVFDELIRTPKSNFANIQELYEKDILSNEARKELNYYQSMFSAGATIENVNVPAEFKGALRSYQQEGLNWLNRLDDLNFGACLADDMGLGKTIQVLAFMLLQRSKQQHLTNLVVVPTSLLFNWQAEAAKFAPSLKVHVHYGSDRVKNTDIFNTYEMILTTYGMMVADIGFLKKYRFNYIFLDESQVIKNPSSQRYKAARMLQSRNKVVMTGTPIENNTFDLYGQLSFACPGLLGNMQHFKDVYSLPIDTFGERKRALELQEKIKPFILRRTKRQVASELPEKTEMVIYCEMGEEQRKVYDDCEKELRDFIFSRTEEELSKNRMHVLTGLTRLRQVCDSPVLLKNEGHPNISSKIEVLMEQIENKSGEHKILVFSQFVSMLDLIRKELSDRNISFEYLTGQTRNRSAKVNAFREDQNIRVFLVSLKAGGTGLNLTEADYVYLVDPWWNPAVENQAIDRCYRIGQDKHVVAVRLICPGTVEEKILKLQETKNKLANDLIRTDASILHTLSKQDITKLLEKAHF